jgi:LuxR family maltose regulon positive regulatory protein
LIAEAFAALARVQLAQKDYQGVQETLNRTDTLSRHTPLDPWALSWLNDSRVRLWLSTGRIEEALEWINLSGLSADDEFNYHHDLHHIILARVLVARLLVNPSIKLQDENLRLLARLLAATNRAGWVHQKISILILQALAHHALDDGSSSLAALENALKLAEPGGYIRSFIGEGSTVIDLLQMINSVKDGDVYIRMLIAAQTMEEMSPTHETDSPSSLSQQKVLLEQLSDRELQVLRLLNSSLSAAEIADELYIAVSTTRTHIKSIYQKLDVHSRLEAVERARDLGLI